MNKLQLFKIISLIFVFSLLFIVDIRRVEAAQSTFYSTSADGRRQSSNTTYSTARSGSSVGGDSGGVIEIGQTPGYATYESFISFDTSSIPDNATIDSVTLSISGNTDGSVTDFTIEARLYDWGPTLDNADWVPGANMGSYTRLSTASSANFSTGYMTFTEDGVNFRNNINKTGWTRIVLTSNRFVSGTVPTSQESIYMNGGGLASKPTLVVNYTIPNTPPTISVQPSASYGGKTRIGPNNMGTYSFTVTDAEQTGVNALNYVLKRSDNNSVVHSTTYFTSGDPQTKNISYNDANLTVGSNQLYMTISDGTLTTNSNSFTVLRDDTAPTAATSISTTPSTPTSNSYTVTFTPNDALSTNSNEISYKICTANDTCVSPITGGTGTSTSGASKTTGTLTDSALVNGVNNRWVRTCDGANNCTNTGFTVTADFKPTVTTSAAGSITADSAILNSTINPNGASTNVSYLWGTTPGVDCDLQPNTLAGPTALTGTSNLSGATTQATLPSLSSNEPYYFCVMATNTYGTTYGSVLTFNTETSNPSSYTYMDAGFAQSGGATDCNDASGAPCAPNLSSVGSATQTSLTANFTSTTGPAHTSYNLFYCDRTANGVCTPNSQIGGSIASGATSYVHNSGITCGRTYAYLLRAVNAEGTSADSTVRTGSTSSCVSAPTVTTPTSSSITSSGATLGANVTSDGGASITSRGTCWGTSPSPTGNCASTSGTTGVFTHARTGMPFNTLIYYRGYAVNSAGTGYSTDSTFTTSKKANGETCSSASECVSNICYVDNDGDRYAPSSGTKKCHASSQLGGTDCYDLNAIAYPGSGACESVNRGASIDEAGNTGNSMDYDCNNSVFACAWGNCVPQCISGGWMEICVAYGHDGWTTDVCTQTATTYVCYEYQEVCAEVAWH